MHELIDPRQPFAYGTICCIIDPRPEYQFFVFIEMVTTLELIIISVLSEEKSPSNLNFLHVSTCD